MSLERARYYFEHELLPKTFFRNRLGFVEALLAGKGNLLYELMAGVCEDYKIVCPYTAGQYKCNIKEIRGYLLLNLSFPETEASLQCPEAYCVFDKRHGVIRYFNIECEYIKRKRIFFLCEWDSGFNHHNYGKIRFGRKGQEKKVMQAVSGHIAPIIKVT